MEMAEYIKREALLRHLNDIWLSAMPNDFMPDDDRHLAMVRCMGLNDAMDAVKTIPAADVRPVVVCANCEHNNACLTQAFVEEASRVPFDRNTFFCADGKRADDA